MAASVSSNMRPRGTHDYERFIKPSELSSSCRRAGLDITNLIGMTYNPFTKVYALGADTDVNYILGTSKPAQS